MPVLLAATLCVPAVSFAQQANDGKIDRLEQQVQELERKVDKATAFGSSVPFLFGVFCALWAQNTGRSAWLWFFLGLFFSVITVIVLLVKNSGDIRERGGGGVA